MSKKGNNLLLYLWSNSEESTVDERGIIYESHVFYELLDKINGK
tara:strand:+ start:373 stop:504 length:132 start_codon:yes stop_codon:yes gene_type:complete